MDVDRLASSLALMKDKISTEVFGPMSEWTRDYKKVQVWICMEGGGLEKSRAGMSPGT